MSEELHGRFLKNRSQQFGPDSCFICGAHIPEGSKERTAEHVFPKWLLRELNLWDDSITPINGVLFAYRKLTVPCCRTCNGTDLSPVEMRVKEAFHAGLHAFESLDRRDLFLWLGKNYYGLVYRESLLPRSVRVRDGERLVPDEHLQSLSFHHFLLQASAGLVQWQPETPGPASFHFFECLDNDPANRFDYLDDLFTPILAMRMGTIGVVCVLQDWGRSEGVQEPHLVGARTVQLHPTQFREVYGRLNYMTKVSWRNLVHPVIGGEETATVVAASPGEFAGSFDVEEFSKFMSTIWQVPVETIFKNGVACSTIFDESGNPFSANTQDLVFTAPYGDTGLWPGHALTLSRDAT